jgi:hypothetical protein
MIKVPLFFHSHLEQNLDNLSKKVTLKRQIYDHFLNNFETLKFKIKNTIFQKVLETCLFQWYFSGF